MSMSLPSTKPCLANSLPQAFLAGRIGSGLGSGPSNTATRLGRALTARLQTGVAAEASTTAHVSFRRTALKFVSLFNLRVLFVNRRRLHQHRRRHRESQVPVSTQVDRHLEPLRPLSRQRGNLLALQDSSRETGCDLIDAYRVVRDEDSVVAPCVDNPSRSCDA